MNETMASRLPVSDLLITDIRPLGAERTDVLIRNGRIVRLGKSEDADAATVRVDGGGALAIPGLVEAHAHLDKTLWGMGWHRHQAGPSLESRIETERRLRRELDIDPERQSARQVALAASYGTTAIRSHVDIDTEHGLWCFEGVAATRERFRDVIDIEIVAFPQSGMMIRPGTVELMDQALSGGADVVGGLDPCGIDRDPKGQLDAVFGLAEKHGKPIDIHLHEPGELGAFTLEMIIERTRSLAMQGKVTVSHAFCLGMKDMRRVGALVEAIAGLDIAIATTAPASRPVPAVKDLIAAGVRVCAGSDGIRDTWGPYGNADMLERAMFVGLRNNLRRDDEVELALSICTAGGASVMGIADYGLHQGAVASLVLVDAETVAEAVAARPKRRLVVSHGRIVARDGEATFTVE